MTAPSPARTRPLARTARSIGLALLGVAVLVALWEGYKAIDGRILGWQLPARADDRSMPHVWEMISRLDDPENRGTSRTVGVTVLEAAWYTFRLALAGFVLGSGLGLVLAMVMARSKLAERGILPLIIMSQTVPIVALAPLVVIWGGRLELFGMEWEAWMSVSVIAAFLAFAPVAINTLRGLSSPSPAALELMSSYAASPRVTMFKLRFPAAIPYLVPGLRLAAAGSIVGAIVAEISIGRANGIGRLVLEYSREATSDPAKVYTAIFGAGLLGLVAAGLVGLADAFLLRNRPKETMS